MDEIIRVKQNNDGTQAVSARELHKALGVKKWFTDWIKLLERFDEGVDFVFSPKGEITKVGNHGAARKLDDYILTLDTAKQLCMLTKTAKGDQVRRYFIEVEKKFNSPLEVIKRAQYFLQNENAQLKIELDNEQQKRLAAENKVVELTPKADYTDKVLQCKDLFSVTLIAKDYGMGPISFNQLLHRLGVIYRRDKTWVPYAKYQTKRWMASKTNVFKRTDGSTTTVIHYKWTQKGRLGLYELLKKNDILPMMEQTQQMELIK